ncbi:unnamed protein product [Phyllotreta striolata]|uniref:Uncharacterized protein n=1 Tax=Phyllotreta striolata TaxID=444603 RepID=A0A9P0E1A3_PHYSR|nr:unnamed protein product [Phyllotreta striolata]
MVEFSENEREKLRAEALSTVIEVGSSSLQEEHRKTGKALAIGIVVFVVALGLYHAVVYGSSRLSALVGGFIIMLLYVVSLLYSWHRKKKLTKSNEAALQQKIKEVIVKASKSPLKKPDSESDRKQAALQERPLLVRTYSVA